MHIVCLDLEGVLVPEIWIAFAEKTGIPELALTTRDIPDYDRLMKRRIRLLAEHRLGLEDIQDVIRTLSPLPGALQFLDDLREASQVIILSDTFTQFASPLMRKLRRPTLFCNTLLVDETGNVVDYRLRMHDGKRHAVAALSSIGFHVVAAGDSYNDIAMLEEADAGILFRPPEGIRLEYPGFPSADEYPDMMDLIRSALDASEPENHPKV